MPDEKSRIHVEWTAEVQSLFVEGVRSLGWSENDLRLFFEPSAGLEVNIEEIQEHIHALLNLDGQDVALEVHNGMTEASFRLEGLNFDNISDRIAVEGLDSGQEVEVLVNGAAMTVRKG